MHAINTLNTQNEMLPSFTLLIHNFGFCVCVCVLSTFQEAARRREEEDRRARERAEEEEARCLERFMDAEPLDPKELHTFTDSMLPGCFHLLDELPDTVYRLCDLLMTAIKRNGPEYRDLILGQVVHQVSGLICLHYVLIQCVIPCPGNYV